MHDKDATPNPYPIPISFSSYPYDQENNLLFMNGGNDSNGNDFSYSFSPAVFEMTLNDLKWPQMALILL